MKLLLITAPDAYRGGNTDVPGVYARTTADPEIEVLHTTPLAVLRCAAGKHTGFVPALEVPKGSQEAGFFALPSDDLSGASLVSLAEIDLVFDRTLKPFPEGFMEVLCGWSGRVPFVNEPLGIAEHLQPSFPLRAAGPYSIPAVVTQEVGEAECFFIENERVVMKLPNSCGGRGVFRLLREGDGLVLESMAGRRPFASFAAAFGHVLTLARGPFTVMRHVGRVEAGDKRVVVIDGKIEGAYLRRADGWIQNVSAGARCTPATVDADEIAAVESSVGVYLDRGIHLLGYDFLLDDDGRWRISEINAGNIGGLLRLEALSGAPVVRRFLQFLKELATRSCGVRRAG